MIPGSRTFEGTLYLARADGSASRMPGADSDCDDCEWLLVPACPAPLDPNNPSDPNCTGAATNCPDPADTQFRVYLRRPPDPFGNVGAVCLGPAQSPVRAADLDVEVQRYFESLPLPEPTFAFQPSDRALVNLPTIFYAERQSLPPATFGPLGITVTITPTVTEWIWQFDPGETLTTTSPGAPYPSKDIAFTYRTRGARPVVLAARWGATYTIEGITGSRTVTGSVTRRTARTVNVREARAELIGGAEDS